ncbi:MAG: CHASE2 domain-containing protein [Cyanobacteria bacterium P01_D01_bin.1]
MSKTKILILAANPKNTSRRRLDEEVRDIEAGVERARFREQFEIVTKFALRTGDIQRALLDEKPTIVHFSGQGKGLNGLIVEDKDGKAKIVSTYALARLFKFFKNDVECVVLNACYSEEQAEAIREHISYVVGVDGELTSREAIQFATGFYDALGAGRSYEDAAEMGQIAQRMAAPALPKVRRSFRTAIFASLGISTLLLATRFFGLMQPIELAIYDRLMRMPPLDDVDHRIAIVKVDRSRLSEWYDNDLEEAVGEISDFKLLEIINYLIELGRPESPKIIGVDILRDEKQEEPRTEENRGKVDYYPELKEALSNPENQIFSICTFASQTIGAIPPVEDSLLVGFSDLIYSPEDGHNAIRSQFLTLDEPPSDICKINEAFSFKVALRFIRKKLPGVITETVEQAPKKELASEEHSGYININNVTFEPIWARTGGFQGIPEGGYQILLNYRKTAYEQAFEIVSAHHIIDCIQGQDCSQDQDIQKLKDAGIILIGYMGEESGDIYDTPIGKLDGVVIHAQMISYLLSTVISDEEGENYNLAKLYVLPTYEESFSIILMSICGGMLVWVVYDRMKLRKIDPNFLAIASSVAVVVLICGVGWAAFTAGLWLPIFPLSLGFVCSAFGTFIAKQYNSRRED